MRYIQAMKNIAACFFAFFLTVPAAFAQDSDAPPSEGLSLMEWGAQMFLDGILKEMEPAIEDFSGLAEEMGPALRQFADQMGPKLADLMNEIEDWSAYLPPEVLPNGDIIIRRKPEAPMVPPATPTEPAPQIDL
ncbi:hypothetical protein Z945_2685 [Sulfitobacter noctilucae]|uniref:hypothetical protein n=1 Tax=Sulfitobacter noctilucae TaxID=1342302 RepID=UPI000AD99BF2|nr:hypothetical protein [Sulfitobacter noctilucae]KIN61692.1 hypothetical protein Z945_2685 [Sulfitobacter noctilucae]